MKLIGDLVFAFIFLVIILAIFKGEEVKQKEETRKANTISVNLDAGQWEEIPEGKYLELKPGQLYDPDTRRAVRLK